jgi:hypothetical protein
MDLASRLDRAPVSHVCPDAVRSHPADREQTATPVVATVARAGLVAALTLVAACGGGKRADRYAAATNLQEACCEHLAADARASCLQAIVRAPDPDVAKAPANQATFACVQEHFVCDPATGHATAESAQAQLDCIQDLPQ